MGSGEAIARLRVPDEVARLVRGLHPAIKRKVRTALQAIIETPNCGKPLKDELAGLRSLRIGRIRIVYRLAEDRTIEVISIGPRRPVYEETYRKVRREND
jgi:mRNA interferase RelE/StbE